MQPATVVRNWQLDQLRKNVKIIGRLLDSTAPDATATYRDNGEGWTVLEVMCHLRDYEQLFLERACLTVDQEFPNLPNPNPDQLAAERNYKAQNLAAAYTEWSHRREGLLAHYTQVDEEDWSRTANHPVRGSMSLVDQLILTVWHDNNHLEQMTRILAEKKR